MGHPAFVAGVAKTMVRLRPLDLILIPRARTQTLKPVLFSIVYGPAKVVP
jgi:hypothetical protein